jgi:hypothetical protein
MLICFLAIVTLISEWLYLHPDLILPFFGYLPIALVSVFAAAAQETKYEHAAMITVTTLIAIGIGGAACIMFLAVR